MSKFCAHCGLPIEDDARFCGACGGEQPMTNVPQPAQQPVWQPVQQSVAQQPAKPKKSKKKFILIGGIAAAVVALALVFVFVVLPMLKGGSTDTVIQEMIVFSEGGNDYYATPYLFKLNGDDNPSLVKVHYSNGTERNVSWIDCWRTARDGETIYSYKSTEMTLYQTTFIGEGEANAEAWMIEDDFAKAAFGDWPEYWHRFIRNLSCDDEYLYFNALLPKAVDYDHATINYKVGKISLSTKEFTEVTDVRAFDLITFDGWLYYIDPGYYFNDETGPYGKIDQDRIGIYRVRPDGSEKALLRSLRWEEWDGYNYGIADELNLIDGKLYYTDYSAEGKGRICRMNPDGSGVEYVSKNPAYHYAVDTEHNKIYYISSSYEGGRGAGIIVPVPHFFCYDCSDGAESAIPHPQQNYDYMSLTYHDGYIYFANGSEFKYGTSDQGTNLCGMRYHISSGAFQNLIGYNDGELVEKRDPKTGRKKGVEWVEGEDHLYWEAVDPSVLVE